MTDLFTNLSNPSDLATRLAQGDTRLAAFLFEHTGLTWASRLTRTIVFGRGEISVLGLALEASSPALLDFLVANTRPRPYDVPHLLSYAASDPMANSKGETRDWRSAASLALSGGRSDAVRWVLDAHESMTEHDLKDMALSWDARLKPTFWLNAWASSWTQEAPVALARLLHERLGMRGEDWLATEVGEAHAQRSGQWLRGRTVPLPFAMAWSMKEPEAVAWLVDEAGVDPNARAGWEGTPFVSWLDVAVENDAWHTAAALQQRGATWTERASTQAHNARAEAAEQWEQAENHGDDKETYRHYLAARMALLDSLILQEHVPKEAQNPGRRPRI